MTKFRTNKKAPKGYTYGFTQVSRSWYADSWCFTDGVIEQIMIGLYAKDGGCRWEFGIRWHDLGRRPATARRGVQPTHGWLSPRCPSCSPHWRNEPNCHRWNAASCCIASALRTRRKRRRRREPEVQQRARRLQHDERNETHAGSRALPTRY